MSALSADTTVKDKLKASGTCKACCVPEASSLYEVTPSAGKHLLYVRLTYGRYDRQAIGGIVRCLAAEELVYQV